ncbi:hypothetical protein LJK88_20870 [Paenibacillus sp. P26]|nr:hypothetical protein LJK88_20870 [Paenibacillus sp. P26]UUZ95921.1 hypothetical protein LJK87_16995 [Paenibacillus sp. P25]
MLGERISEYRRRLEEAKDRLEEPEQALILELIRDLETLAEENKNLKTAVLGHTKKSIMSSRLRDALME